MSILRTLILISLFNFIAFGVLSQDTLTPMLLEPFTYEFEITKAGLEGPGADFLRSEMKSAQYTMLGEYHGSKRISEFTGALIPVLNGLGYNTMVLEVGPVTGRKLNDLPKGSNEVIKGLKEINTKYALIEEDGYTNTPIPFFSNVEDAAFLGAAKENDWHILGVDQEFILGYIMLTDWMWENLNKGKQAHYERLYLRTRDTIMQYYRDELAGNQRSSIAVSESETIDSFLNAMLTQKENGVIVDAFRSTTHIYRLNAERQWYQNNSQRIDYMKKELRKGLDEIDFDLNQDKLLIKMGGYHLARGFSPLGLYEVGNMLSELADFHGNESLNITFATRYYMEQDTLRDYMEQANSTTYRYKDVLQMGQKDKWVVIDLRPLIEGFYYYPQMYVLNEWMQDLVKRYDLLVIPPIETSATPNY